MTYFTLFIWNRFLDFMRIHTLIHTGLYGQSHIYCILEIAEILVLRIPVWVDKGLFLAYISPNNKNCIYIIDINAIVIPTYRFPWHTKYCTKISSFCLKIIILACTIFTLFISVRVIYYLFIQFLYLLFQWKFLINISNTHFLFSSRYIT